MNQSERPFSLKSKSTQWLILVPALFCIAIFLFHFSVIRANAVNVPFWDDWAAFDEDNHPASLDLPWMFRRHNEHRIVTTKLFIWAQFQLNGWNIRTHLLFAFLIYGSVLALLWWLSRNWTRQTHGWMLLCFIPFFLTPLGSFDHFMAFTVSIHLWLLFFVLATYFLFAEDQRWARLVLGWAFSILSLYSWAAGFVTALILLIGYSAFKTLRAYRTTAKPERTREVLQLVASLTVVGVALISWLHDYRKPAHHPALVFPYQREFWNFFSNLVSLGLGIGRISTLAGIICLLVILTPVVGIIWRKRLNMSASQWAVCVSVLALLANQCAITMGRAGFGIADSKNPEYAEIGLPLIILIAASWIIFLKHRKRLKRSAVGLLWIFFFVIFLNKWGDFWIYRAQRVVRVEGVRCIQAYYDQKGDGHCPTIFPADRSIAPFLDRAKQLNASFYQEATATTDKR